jgi:hypothetical protein
MVRVERAQLSRDRRGRFVRVTVRGLPERCNSQSAGCDPMLELCPAPDWGWEIEVPVSGRYRKRVATTFSCANRSWTDVWPRKRPSHCMLFAHNMGIHAYQYDLQNIHWRHWGARRATGSAVTVYVGMGTTVRTPVKLRAGRPRTTCGHYAYTRLRVAASDGRWVVHLRPPACHRALRGAFDFLGRSGPGGAGTWRTVRKSTLAAGRVATESSASNTGSSIARSPLRGQVSRADGSSRRCRQ